MRICGYVFAAVAAWLAVGCAPSETEAERAAREGIFLVNNGSEPRDLDPHVVTGFPEHQVIKALMEGLVAEHPTDSNLVVPGVAERWEPNADATVWTFQLRPEARWSSGAPVTAEDFVYAYRRILNPAFAAPYASMLYLLENAEAYHQGEITDWQEVGVHAPDPLTLRLTLAGPTPHFPLVLTHYTYFPVPRETFEELDVFARRDSGWTRPENHVGNGPFVLDEWVPDQQIVVTKNRDYWDAEAVSLNGIKFFPVQDRQTEFRMFTAGQLHKTDGVPFNLRDKLRADGNPTLREDTFFNTGYFGLNTTRAALADRRVRRALAQALDIELIIEKVTKNGRPAEGFVAPGIEGYPYQNYRIHDPAAARALLAEAGYPGGEGLPELEYILVNADTSRALAETVQAMWAEELGVRVRLETKEWQVLISEIDAGNFDIFSLAWVGDYLDPMTFLKIMRSGDGNNRTGFADPEFDRLLARAAQTADRAERMRLMGAAEARLMAARPIIPMTWANLMYLLAPEVSGFPAKALADQPYKHIRLAPVGDPAVETARGD